MRTIVFLFGDTANEAPQLNWALQNFISSHHRILLIKTIPNNVFLMNDPHEMTFSLNLSNTESRNNREKAIEFLEEVSNKIKNYFYEMEVVKCVVIGDEFSKLRPILNAVDVNVVILGPETNKQSIFGGCVDKYVVDDVGIPILRVNRERIHKY